MSTRIVNTFKWNIFCYISREMHTRIWSQEKANTEASANWKEVKGKSEEINELILKLKADLNKGPNNI